MRDHYRKRITGASAVLATVFAASAGCGYWMYRDPGNAGWLWLVQTGLLVVAGAAVWLAGRRIDDDLLRPLESCRQWLNDRRAAGVAATPMHTLGRGTWGRLAADLNDLVDQLARLSRESDLRLRQQARSLELLYDFAASINVAHDLDDLLSRSIRVLKETMGAHAGSARLVGKDGQLRLVAHIGTDQDVVELKQQYTLSAHTIDTGEHGGLEEVAFFKHLNLISVPLQYRNRTHGVIDLYMDSENFVEAEDTKKLLTSIGRYLGIAVERHGLDPERERLSRMEERTRLANELHDSLAQTLASLRFQVRVLDETLHQNDESAIWQEMERVESSLDEAHSELRELIFRFRAPVESQGLVPAVEKMVNRLKLETGMAIFLQNNWEGVKLSEEHEREVIRIVQEALTNIRKHSRANTVRVMLRSGPDGNHRVLVEDDGIGVRKHRTPPAARGEQLGLKIMQERAAQLGGTLKVESEYNEGTRVLLTFQVPENEHSMALNSAAF